MPVSVDATRKLLARGLSVLIVVVLASIAWPPLNAAAGVVALALLVPALFVASRRTRVVSILIASLGIGSGVVAATLGEFPSLVHTGRLNQDLIAMLAGGLFIGLTVRRARGHIPSSTGSTGTGSTGAESTVAGSTVAGSEANDVVAWHRTGMAAVFRTAAVTHLFGSVLSMVSVGIVGDQLSAQSRLSARDATLLGRSFAIAALWSPFWTVLAVIVVLVPGVNLWRLFSVGAVFAAALLLLGAWQNASSRGPAVRVYRGYTLDPRQLVAPAALITLVLGSHFALPETPVPRLVLLAAVSVTLVILWVRFGLGFAVQMMREVAGRGLANSANEVALFLAAGVLTIGAGLLVVATRFQLDLPRFDWFSAWLLVLLVVALAGFGVHPIITISLAVSLMQPFTGDATLLAASITWAWALAAPTGPLSATTIYLTQRYGVRVSDLVRQNVPFTAMGVTLAIPGLAVVAALG